MVSPKLEKLMARSAVCPLSGGQSIAAARQPKQKKLTQCTAPKKIEEYRGPSRLQQTVVPVAYEWQELHVAGGMAC